MKTKSFLFFLLLCLGVSSCESEHFNDWETMEWKTIPEMQFLEEFPYYVVQIPAEGAEYTLICTNYGFTDLSVYNYGVGVLFTEMDVNDIVFEELTEKRPHFENEWLSITMEARNTIKIVAQPNTTTSSRKMYITAGSFNVGTNFLLRQAPGEQESEP
ncbi:MAG: hypothetical protein J6M53_04060 [Bacteroidaceae bacterium]|nr:hypothetical protein [Bacteroidaceae bacterium]